MKTEKFDYQEINKLRKEIHFLKDRINLIEAALDIQEWKSVQDDSADLEQTLNVDDLKQKN
jgi:hypothetical protein